MVRGETLYKMFCSACHGKSGRGDGPAADALRVQPRDFRYGRFRYISTLDGVPTREDLVRTINTGRGASPTDTFTLVFTDNAVSTTLAQDVGAIDKDKATELRNRCWKALGEVADAQAEHLKASDPPTRYLELLRSAITSGQAHLTRPDGEAPTKQGHLPYPLQWGWRQYGPTSWPRSGTQLPAS